MKECKNKCDHWLISSNHYFIDDYMNEFCIRGKSGKENSGVKYCPWCGAILVDKDAALKEEFRVALNYAMWGDDMGMNKVEDITGALFSKFNITRRE